MELERGRSRKGRENSCEEECMSIEQPQLEGEPTGAEPCTLLPWRNRPRSRAATEARGPESPPTTSPPGSPFGTHSCACAGRASTSGCGRGRSSGVVRSLRCCSIQSFRGVVLLSGISSYIRPVCIAMVLGPRLVRAVAVVVALAARCTLAPYSRSRTLTSSSCRCPSSWPVTRPAAPAPAEEAAARPPASFSPVETKQPPHKPPAAKADGVPAAAQ